MQNGSPGNFARSEKVSTSQKEAAFFAIKATRAFRVLTESLIESRNANWNPLLVFHIHIAAFIPFNIGYFR